MTSPAKRKGDRAELAVQRVIVDAGWPCERIPAGAEADRGDLWVPVIEWPSVDVKDHATHSLGAWLDRAQIQAINAGRASGAVVWKRRGTTDARRWFYIQTLGGFLDHMEQLRR